MPPIAEGFRGQGGLSCKNCQRKKIKCDLNTPCAACQKSGISTSCTRDQIPAAYQKLLDRIQTLEKELREQNDDAANTGRDRSEEVISPVEAVVQSHQSPSTQFEIQSLLPRFTDSQLSSANDEQDAAQVLEFLAWGRKKDQVFYDAPENDSGPRRHSIEQVENAPQNQLSNSYRKLRLEILEMLLPSQESVGQLVEFHDRCLVWYHGSYNTITFQKELQTFYTLYKGGLRDPNINLQWVALLFSIIAGSITCTSKQTASMWGFHEEERARLSKEWYEATVTCLYLSGYLEMHTIYSVQAISTLTISAHIIGMSNSQSVLLASANRIAQSLGLHRLGSEPTETAEITDRNITARIKRETGRRIWCQLCTQDWFSIPFSESYALNHRYFNTTKPENCNDDNVIPLPPNVPSITSYCNYLYEIASLMPELQDAMNSSKTAYTRYEQVLSYDEKMRQLATQYMPTFLSTSFPVTSNLPVFTTWARRSLAICAAHKIIMIHRKFLGTSFTNSAYSFTRRTCIAASKTILKEARAAFDLNGPVLWIDQAFTVAAGIILCLDAYHRESSEAEFAEHKKLAIEAIEYLKNFSPFSKIASRGISLLSLLTNGLENISDSQPVEVRGSSSRKRSGGTPGGRGNEKRRKTFNLPNLMHNLSANIPEPSDIVVSPSHLAWNAFSDVLGPQTGFGEDNLFGDLFDFVL